MIPGIGGIAGFVGEADTESMFVGSATTTGTGSITLPSGIQSGDTLVLIFSSADSRNDVTLSGGGTFTTLQDAWPTGSGWSSLSIFVTTNYDGTSMSFSDDRSPTCVCIAIALRFPSSGYVSTADDAYAQRSSTSSPSMPSNTGQHSDTYGFAFLVASIDEKDTTVSSWPTTPTADTEEVEISVSSGTLVTLAVQMVDWPASTNVDAVDGGSGSFTFGATDGCVVGSFGVSGD